MTISSRTSHSIKPFIKPLLAGGLLFSLIAILLEVNGVQSIFSNPASFGIPSAQGKSLKALSKDCGDSITETASLSREQLLKLLAVPERDSKSRVQQIVNQPYCQLSTIQVRAGVDAVREAYPLEFDPETTLVILYENDEYAGYRFKH